MASYPTSVFAVTTHNTGDVLEPVDVNNPESEINAIEAGLLNGFQHHLKPLTNNTYDLGTAALVWRDLYVARYLRDANGNILIGETATAAAVDYLGVTNGAAGNPGAVILSALGTDANVNLQHLPKGTGGLLLGVSAPATTATGGFPYLSAVAGTPTGVPVSQTGYAPIQLDTTGNHLWAYLGGAWKQIDGGTSGPTITVVTATGTYTTPTNAKKLLVYGLGSGGGGAGGGAAPDGGSGGGSGAFSMKLILSPAATYPVTIGAGGAGGVAGGTGGTGGTSSFGTVITGLGGGVGGVFNNNAAKPGGAGGTAGTGGDINNQGTPGAFGWTSLAAGGSGGANVFLGAGSGSTSLAAGAAATPNSGSGGAGAWGNFAGGAGAAAVFLVLEFYA